MTCPSDLGNSQTFWRKKSMTCPLDPMTCPPDRVKENHRRPSKHRLEEHDMLNWFKHTKKLIAKGECPQERIEKFAVLMETANKYRRKNQHDK